jgi:hypothetical protein
VTSFTVLYDACVLYSAPLRDLLMELATCDLYRARWTDRIHDEWIRNLLKKRPDLIREKILRARDLMNEHVLDSLVTDYEMLIESLSLPDPDDRHVLAAAIRSSSGTIVTYNTKDFPPEKLSPYGIEAQHPDQFLVHLIDLHPAATSAAAKRHRARLKNPPRSVEEYLGTLAKLSLPETVARLREYSEVI